MKTEQFPLEMQPYLVPTPSGKYIYECSGCKGEYGIEKLLYTCPECKSVLMIKDREWERLKAIPGSMWRKIFDYRSMSTLPALRGIYRYHELIGSMMPLDSIICLGEGHTPVVAANQRLVQWVGIPFHYKNDGQNPSASFKDRGMASAFSYLNYLIRNRGMSDVLAICASTGDTSAAAALYASYLVDGVKSAVLLPHGKVTPQQLGQPLGSGAKVIEIPGVFDDCMKIVEYLSENFSVALMNSKNAWRILGQESYSYEIAQAFDYEVGNLVVVVPIGNAGNITAVLQGFLKLFDLGIIASLPTIIGVQSEHANPVYLYYLEAQPQKRQFRPVTVRPSVAQAAMIGNPVSMPRVVKLVEQYRELAGEDAVQVLEVSEQEIMDAMLMANRNGHISCTQGGECLAGIRKAVQGKIISDDRIAVLDATAHALKFAVFQEKYFSDRFEPEFEVVPKKELQNAPVLVSPPESVPSPGQGKPLDPEEFKTFVEYTAKSVADLLGLKIR
ncbi:threonine synthase [Desulforhabdus amnigena]|jgi:threonine synthase|uniref:Threonine synthase n=1 Tax=Desulforhabdus amnigena TaxID=40218 RepID=A0A9W6FU79_9BACT|nr:threonine synthase [Desulforhabdus amnigena]NLJ27445.1 threonine synthase [Deltaproteobacteria bacterium]GLI34970.1 threonine synthase [Desulforhabdus amnigena]